MKELSIIGTRGVPAKHGGFETFAEHLALYLTKRGWSVTVYCQADGHGETVVDEWMGITRVTLFVPKAGAAGTVQFDFRTVIDVCRRRPKLVLTLGYNTAIFCLPFRILGIRNLINMDGIEWRREKWSAIERMWLWLNERAGCMLGNHLIADHPEIKRYLSSKTRADKITTIPYGADKLSGADPAYLEPLGVIPGMFATLIARPEPENSILEIVRAFSKKVRGYKLVVLGNYQSETNEFHRKVKDAAGSEVIFPGAIYDKNIVSSLRFFSKFYVHGHKVGGTNPSLVEALGAGCAVLAHDNIFNRWVIGEGGLFFADEVECATIFDTLDEDNLKVMREKSLARFDDAFQWEYILNQYETLLAHWHP